MSSSTGSSGTGTGSIGSDSTTTRGAGSDLPEGDGPQASEHSGALAEEQGHLDAMYARLAVMRADAVRRKDDARFSSDGTPSGRFTRDALQYRYAEEIAALSAAESKLCFGRIDDEAGEQRHIGRMGMTDGTQERRQILIDWRAPSSAPFYTATSLTPQGVVRRRHLQTRRSKVLSVADEFLQASDLGDPRDSQELGSAGDSALLEALNAPRTGRMQDIIATIQGEQDTIIRSDRAGVLVVQGGPGTGKTVVALHRAAFLLYTHRERLGGHGVLVIGPNRTFLDYIGQVLPSLGESSVVLATPGTLFPGVQATAVDDPEVAEVKGRASMAAVIDAAVLDRQRMPRRPRVIEYDGGSLRLEPGMLTKAQRRAWGTRLPHNRARQIFLRSVLDSLARQVAGRPGVKQAPEEESVSPATDVASIRKDLQSDDRIVAGLSDLWPALTPQELIGDLLSDPRRLDFAGPTISRRTRPAMLRPLGSAWTVGDVALLDEAAELLGEIGVVDRAWSQHRAEEVAYAQEALDALADAGADQEDSGIGFTVGMVTAEDLADMNTEDRIGVTTADRAAGDREWTYGHVIVDEAQELSPMTWRMVMRRCPVKSMTLVGDVAQTSNPAGATDWGRMLRPHVADRWRLAELTVNYRTPAEIMDVAAGVLGRIDPQQSAPTSVRESGVQPWALQVDEAALGDAVAESVTAELGRLPAGQLAVLVPEERQAEILAAVRTRLPAASGEPGPAHRVTVLTVRESKGLEFDAVVLVEPQQIVARSRRGEADLYVGLTRATQRLAVVHSRPLPPGLRLSSIHDPQGSA